MAANYQVLGGRGSFAQPSWQAARPTPNQWQEPLGQFNAAVPRQAAYQQPAQPYQQQQPQAARYQQQQPAQPYQQQQAVRYPQAGQAYQQPGQAYQPQGQAYPQQAPSYHQPAQPHQQQPRLAQAPVARQDLDAFMEGNKNPAQQAASRASLGLNAPPLAHFLDNVECISIGNFCAVANALEALGLRKYAYPFDWVRSSSQGVIHLFNNKFADFFDYRASEQTEHGPAYTQTAWGGSFWHHDIQDPKVKASFQRRIDRVLGKGEVPNTVPRLFVRTLNSSDEVASALDLHAALQKAFRKTKVYLLLLVDMQDQTGPMRLAGKAGDNILFYKVPLSASMTADINARAQGYWPALAYAIRYWATRQDPISELPSLRHLQDCLDAFDGGNPATALYGPRRVPGTPPTPLPPPVMPYGSSTAAQPLPPLPLAPQPGVEEIPGKGGSFMDVNGFIRRKGEGTLAGFKQGMTSMKESLRGLKDKLVAAAGGA